MPQVKIYALRENIARNRTALSNAIHASIVEALNYPPEKRFHRFMPLDAADFIFPADRSRNYIVIEIVLFAGRSAAAKKALIKALVVNIPAACGIAPTDIEAVLIEMPRENWCIRGLPGDELALHYPVDV